MSDEKNPFDFFQTYWFKDATSQLCADGWPTFVVPLNVKISECKSEYEKLKAENAELKADIESRKESYDRLDSININLNVDKAKLQKKVEILTETLEATAKCCTGLIHEKILQALKDASEVK